MSLSVHVVVTQSGSFHVDRYVYRFDPVELRTRSTSRRRRETADVDDEPSYRMSSTFIEHHQHAGTTTAATISSSSIMSLKKDRLYSRPTRAGRSEDHSQALRSSVASLPRDWNRRSGRPRQPWLQTFESDVAPLNIGLATAYH